MRQVHLSAEDWDVMTEGQSLCDEEGELSGENFEIAMRRQMKLFVQRHMAIRMSQVLVSPMLHALVLCRVFCLVLSYVCVVFGILGGSAVAFASPLLLRLRVLLSLLLLSRLSLFVPILFAIGVGFDQVTRTSHRPSSTTLHPLR